MAAALLRRVRYEIIPLSSSVDCLRALPPASIVSVTCSPSRGIPATQQLCELLLSHGHTPVPHLAARCVDGPSHAAELAAWVRACSLKEVFIVGGDAPRPVSETYKHALPFMSDFLAAKVKVFVFFHAASSPDLDPLQPSPQPHVDRVSFAAHPEAHPSASPATMAQSLLCKQSLLIAHGITGSAVTQMCFDALTIKAWISSSRRAGFNLPIILGVAGPVSPSKLIAVSARIGVGESMRFIARGGWGVAAAVSGFGRPGTHDSAEIIRQLCGDVQGIHCFTFNAVADTAAWVHKLCTAA